MSDLVIATATVAVVIAFIVAAAAFVYCAARELVDGADIARGWGRGYEGPWRGEDGERS